MVIKMVGIAATIVAILLKTLRVHAFLTVHWQLKESHRVVDNNISNIVYF